MGAEAEAERVSLDQIRCVAALALAKAISPDFVGYWQRHRAR